MTNFSSPGDQLLLGEQGNLNISPVPFGVLLLDLRHCRLAQPVVDFLGIPLFDLG